MQPEITWLKSMLIGYTYFSSETVCIIIQSMISQKKLKMYIWYVMLWKFKNIKNATETIKNTHKVYGKGVITDCQDWNWFSKFPTCDTALRDKPRSEHS